MPKRPRIGVTGNSRRWAPSWFCTWIALKLVGADAVRISVRHDPVDNDFHGMIIGGGDDISPEHYGQDLKAKVKLDPQRDEMEIRWIKHALKHRMPLLGICRGAQLINVVRGGSLHQDIRPIRVHTYNRPGLLPTKQVLLEAESQLAQLMGKTRIRVNSLHHQAVAEAGENLTIVGRDLDNIAQAIQATDDHCIIGVQWHPEYLFYLPSQLALFRWLTEQR
jgi:putative glutamine amidotransferase